MLIDVLAFGVIIPVLPHLVEQFAVGNELLGVSRERDEWLRVEATNTAWTSRYEPGAEILVPLKSGEGRYVADERAG